MSGSMNQAIDTVLELAAGRRLQMDVLGIERKTTAVAFQQRKMDEFSFSETRQLGVRIFDGMFEGVAYTESLAPESLAELVADALANSKMIRREWVSELPQAGSFKPIAGMYDPALEEVAPERKVEAARTLEAAALDFDKRIASVAYSRYGDARAEVWVANTRGLRGSYRINSVMAYSRCLAQDKDGNVMAQQVQLKRGFDQLDPALVAREAAEKTLRRLGAVRPATGKYTVVLENRVAEDLIETLADYFSAKSVDEKTSPLAGKLGQKVFSSALHITDDPFRADATGCRPFDEEGYASKVTPLVEGGVVRGFLTNSVLARKLKMPHTASASRAPATDLDVSSSNLIVTPGAQPFSALVGAAPKVIVITSIMGMAGFRPASGDFSIPVEGYLYENGKCSSALKDFLISGNILQLFSAVEAVGQDVLPPAGNTICPSLLIRDLNVSGQSA
jgi:PmbA protein